MQTGAKKKENVMQWLVRYVREAREELNKVTWPSQKETVKYSLIVIAISLFVAAFFAGADWIFDLGLKQLLALTA